MDDQLFEVEEARSLERKRNTRSDQLCGMYETAFHFAFGIPYRRQAGDFVQLARLLRGAPEISDEFWSRAIGHYLTSPMSKYTLADLASRVEVFHRGRLDRYNKPVLAQVQENVQSLTDWINRKQDDEREMDDNREGYRNPER